MARRRTKKRTHVGASNGTSKAQPANSSASRAPKSMVIRIGAGEVGSSVSQLVKDVRGMMEPGTASRLKVSCSMCSTTRELIEDRNEDPTAYETIPQWPALWVFRIFSSFPAPLLVTPIYALQLRPEARPYTFAWRSTPYAKMC